MDLKIKDPQELSLRGRFVQRGKIMGLTRNKKWLGALIDKGFICTANTTVSSALAQSYRAAFKKRLFSMMDVIETKWGDDWDIHLHDGGYDFFIINFVFLYKEVTISNYAKETSRVLKDLIVLLPLDSAGGKAYVRRPWGTRATLSYEEVQAGYRHSHLRALKTTTDYSYSLVTSDFCIGSSGDLPYLLAELQTSYSTEQFEYLLYLIDTSIMCESAEVAPYIRMENIAKGKASKVEDLSLSHYYEMIESHFKYNMPKLPVDFYISDNRYKVKVNQRLHDAIKHWLFSVNTEEKTRYLLMVKKTINGYVNYANEIKGTVDNSKEYRYHDHNNRPAYTIIAGKEVSMKVYKEKKTTKLPDMNEYQVYPKLLEYVSKQLESSIYKATIRASAINSYYSRNNVSGVSGQSEVSL